MIRYDRIDAPTWMIEPFEQTPEGFLKGRACVTNIGVFPYRLADGSIEYELRHPDDVFEADSMASLKLKPITNDHPKEKVTADNVHLFQVGNLGDNPFNGDNIHLTIDMIVQNAKAIDDIMKGKRELSCGYTADIVDESGIWLGMPYTKRQKNIRYNHVAVVESGRAGEATRIKLDSGDGVLIRSFEEDTAGAVDNTNKEEGMAENMKTIQIDSVDYQAEDAVVNAYKSEKVRADSLVVELEAKKNEISTLEAERDSAKEKVDALVLENEKLKKASVDEAEIAKRVDARIALVALAGEVKADVKPDMSDMDIKKAILLAKNPKLALDGKDEVYVNARIDCLQEDIALEKDRNAVASTNGANAPAVPTVNADSAEEAYNRMVDKLRKQGRE